MVHKIAQARRVHGPNLLDEHLCRLLLNCYLGRKDAGRALREVGATITTVAVT